MDPLTHDQAYFARYLKLKERHETDRSRSRAVIADDGQPAHQYDGERRYNDGELTQLNADIDHSSLLMRLLLGKEPLDDPPPCRHAYPVYPED